MAGPRADRQSLAMRAVAGRVAASPRPGDVRVKRSGWFGHPPVTNVACNCVPSVRSGGVGIHPQSNAGLVENLHFGAAGCVAFGSGSMCRWRRSAVVRIPAFRAGDRDGRNAATPGRNGIRNAGSGATRRRPRRRARRRRQTWHRRWCPITELVKLSRGCLKPRAMGRDSVGRSWTIAAGRQISLRQQRPLHTDGKAVG